LPLIIDGGTRGVKIAFIRQVKHLTFPVRGPEMGETRNLPTTQVFIARAVEFFLGLLSR
jgi:hypothetical protein